MKIWGSLLFALVLAATAGWARDTRSAFKDRVNIGRHDGHMQQVAFLYQGPDCRVEGWTCGDENGTLPTGFDFNRKQ